MQGKPASGHRGSGITRAQFRGARSQRCCAACPACGLLRSGETPARDTGAAPRRTEESERRARPRAAEPTRMGTEGRNGARAVHVQLQQTTGVSAANDLPGLNLRRKGGNAVEAALPGRSRGGREGTEPPWRTSPRCLCLCRCSGSGLERGAWASAGWDTSLPLFSCVGSPQY